MKAATTGYFQPSIESQISHEIRIPLSGIVGAIGLLKKTELSCQQEETMKILDLSVTRLETLEEKITELIKAHSIEFYKKTNH